MLAVLGAQAEEMGARRIVFDALSSSWRCCPTRRRKGAKFTVCTSGLLARGLTALITKPDGDEAISFGPQPFGFMHFMVGLRGELNHRCPRVSQRNLRVLKYRGSGFDENESPFVIGRMDSTSPSPARSAPRKSMCRTSGFPRVNGSIPCSAGGYYRGASVLITGFPGTAKTPLSGAFAEAACRRGEANHVLQF